MDVLKTPTVKRNHSIQVAPRNGNPQPFPKPLAVIERDLPDPPSGLVRNIGDLIPVPQTIFTEDSVHAEYDILSEEEKAHLEYMRRHGEHEHHHQALQSLAAHRITGDVDQLDRAIAVLLHLRKTQHLHD